MHDDTSAHAHRTDAHQHCGAPVAVIDHKPITHNLKQLRHVLACNGPERTPRIWAVAKADAYGHTLEHAYPGLSGADGLAVLTLDEARHCRALGWTGPILVMSAHFTQAALEDPGLYPLHLIIDQQEQLGQIGRAHV